MLKRPAHVAALIVVLTTWTMSSPYNFAQNVELGEMLRNIHWYGSASIKIESGGKTIYIDPYFQEAMPETHDADLILITHRHGRHFSPELIKNLSNDQTVVFVPEDCKEDLQGVLGRPATVARIGKPEKVGSMTVEPVPAYTLRHQDHARELDWVGYLLTVDGLKIYHSGSTDPIPELKRFTCDIAILAFYEDYIMSTEEAAQVATDMKARAVIPIHYASDENASRLKELLKGKAIVDIRKPES